MSRSSKTPAHKFYKQFQEQYFIFVSALYSTLLPQRWAVKLSGSHASRCRLNSVTGIPPLPSKEATLWTKSRLRGSISIGRPGHCESAYHWQI